MTEKAAPTPGFVRAAVWVNLVLVLAALILPRTLVTETAGIEEAARAALLFVIPMTLVVVIGCAVGIRAYVLARRLGQRVKWTAFLPLATFLAGIAGTLLLVYGQYV
jgi:hypothetical protein